MAFGGVLHGVWRLWGMRKDTAGRNIGQKAGNDCSSAMFQKAVSGGPENGGIVSKSNIPCLLPVVPHITVYCERGINMYGKGIANQIKNSIFAQK